MSGIEWPHDSEEGGKRGYTDSSFADEDDFIDEEMFMLDDEPIDDSLIDGPTGSKDASAIPLLTNDVQNIPGSPWAQPSARQGSGRATEPLTLAKHASTIGLFAAVAWVVAQFIVAIW